MAVAITWPFACPRSWQEQAKPILVRSDVENGFPKVRKRFTRSWAEIQVTWILPWVQKPAVDDFFRLDCQDGAQPFIVVDPFTGANRVVRFKEPPTIAASVDSKPMMQVSATLETVFI
jgi:hypothetical protein